MRLIWYFCCITFIFFVCLLITDQLKYNVLTASELAKVLPNGWSKFTEYLTNGLPEMSLQKITLALKKQCA